MTVCPRTDTNRQTRTGTNRGVMEPVNENEPQEPNRKCVGTEPKIIVIFEFDVKKNVRMIIYLYISSTLPFFNKRFGLRHPFSRVTNP